MVLSCAERIDGSYAMTLAELHWVKKGGRAIGPYEATDYMGCTPDECRLIRQRIELWHESVLSCQIEDDCSEVSDELLEWNDDMLMRGWHKHHVLFVWGGPSSGIVSVCDSAGGIVTPVRSVYYFKDWFDAAYKVLSGDDHNIFNYVIRKLKERIPA